MLRNYRSVLNQSNKLDGAIEALQLELESKIEFEFCISEFPDDGFCIVEIDTACVAPITACIRIIKTKGKLSLKTFNEISI